MSDNLKFAPSAEQIKRAHVTNQEYLALYQKSVDDPEGFWREQGQTIEWMKPFSTVSNVSYDKPNVSIKWYEDGTLNAAANYVTVILKQEATKQPLFGKVMILMIQNISLTNSCMTRSSIFKCAEKQRGVKKVTVSQSICRWYLKHRWRC